MKRLAVLLPSALAAIVLTAGAALAQDYPPDVLGEGGSNVEGAGGAGAAAAGETAFTCSDVSLFLLAAVAFLVVGASAVLISRRRSSQLV
jgi:hypothetical protein